MQPLIRKTLSFYYTSGNILMEWNARDGYFETTTTYFQKTKKYWEKNLEKAWIKYNLSLFCPVDGFSFINIT